MPLPLAVRVLNRAGALAQRVGLPLGSLAPEDVVAAARKQTGLDDVGSPGFYEGLEVLCRSLDEEAGLSVLGRLGQRQQVVQVVANRLEMHDAVARNPEILDEEIAPPIFVAGPPRTGTTLLSHLLQMDPGLRTLRHWEASKPCPPPVLVEEERDPRLAEAAKTLDRLYSMIPEFRAIHPMEPAGPTECVLLLALELRSIHFETGALIPSYGQWLAQADLLPAYETHKRALQLLQWRVPAERWQLKSPAHLMALDALTATYPGARMVWTHRDPVTVVASVASLNTVLHSVSAEHVDPVAVGREWAPKLAMLLDRGCDFRDRVGDDAFHDLDYRDLVNDPIGTIKRLYDWLDRPLTPLAEARMRAGMDANPQDRYGRHTYRLEDHGLDPDEERERFSRYSTRFGDLL